MATKDVGNPTTMVKNNIANSCVNLDNLDNYWVTIIRNNLQPIICNFMYQHHFSLALFFYNQNVSWMKTS
jgi:hypothetical protein